MKKKVRIFGVAACFGVMSCNSYPYDGVFPSLQGKVIKIDSLNDMVVLDTGRYEPGAYVGVSGALAADKLPRTTKQDDTVLLLYDSSAADPTVKAIIKIY